MAINPALLVSAAMMQDYFVDNVTGQAMAGGIITMFEDGARQTLKNWYYQTGPAGGPYTFQKLDNPLTLSAVGTITDPSGADTIPFYYPFDEDDQTKSQTYYVTVVDSNLAPQFTRQNFPSHNGSGGGGGGGNGIQLSNIIANNVFYHPFSINSNIDFTGTIGTPVNTIIAPSNHDGFMAASGNEFRYIKNTGGATDTMKFIPFTQGSTPFLSQQTPALYCSLICGSVQAGEVTKAIQIPINTNIQTMDSLDVTISLWAQGVSGATTINMSLTLFAGSGVPLSQSVSKSIVTWTLSPIWTQYIYSFTMPTASGISVSGTGDDAIYLYINYPTSAQFNINITKPAMYVGSLAPAIITAFADFQTYDEIDQIISGPRTGDVRVSLNNFAPWGWALCNDGTIGNAGSGADFASIETWNLYSLLWNSVSNTYAPVTGGRGANAAADFLMPKTMALPKQLGNAIASKGTSTLGTTAWALGQFGGSEFHTITRDEMAQHAHAPDPAAGGGGFVYTGGGPGPIAGGAVGAETAATGGIISYAGPTPISLTQPTTFYNVFLKL